MYSDALTIIIPLKGRDHCTKRILDQMVQDKVPFKILLADGSGEDNFHVATEYSNKLRVLYINSGRDNTVNDFMKKMFNATSSVQTRYTMLADNDDLVCLNGVYKAIEFLDDNPEYVSFRGALTEKKDGHNFHTYEKSITGNNVLSRVSEDLAAKDATWQDITRTGVMKKLYNYLYMSKTEDLMLTFTMDASLKLIYGKNKKDFGVTTTYHISGEGMILNRPDWLGYKRWLQYPHIYNSLGIYVSAIARGMFTQDGTSRSLAKQQFAEFLVDDIFNVAKGNNIPIDHPWENYVEGALDHSELFDGLASQIL